MISSWAVMASMMSLVADFNTSDVRSRPTYADRSTGGPARIVIVLRGSRLTFLAYGASNSWTPHCATGITGAPVARAIRAAPVLPTIGHRPGSRVIVPSG